MITYEAYSQWVPVVWQSILLQELADKSLADTYYCQALPWGCQLAFNLISVLQSISEYYSYLLIYDLDD